MRRHEDPEHPDWACELQNSIYGQKQATILWFKRMASKLLTMGFRQLYTDTAIFAKFDEDGLACIVVVYADDLIVTGMTYDYIKHVKEELNQEFKIKDLGACTWILGIAVERDIRAGTIILYRRKYIRDMAERFGQQDAAGRNSIYA